MLSHTVAQAPKGVRCSLHSSQQRFEPLPSAPASLDQAPKLRNIAGAGVCGVCATLAPACRADLRGLCKQLRAVLEAAMVFRTTCPNSSFKRFGPPGVVGRSRRVPGLDRSATVLEINVGWRYPSTYQLLLARGCPNILEFAENSFDNSWSPAGLFQPPAGTRWVFVQNASLGSFVPTLFPARIP